MDFVKKFVSEKVETGTVGIIWMGQAGYLLKNSANKILVLDVYLSDLSERLDGNKRLMAALCRPEEVPADIVLASHEHTDHLDLDSIPVWTKQGAVVYCPSNARTHCLEFGMKETEVFEVKTGDVFEEAGYQIEVVYAHHGDTAPDTVGYVITTEGVSIYFTGDTSYQLHQMEYAANKEIQVLLVPINGEYGNMNERDAAMLAAQVKARVTIPCHFWTFARHGGNPYEFVTAMKMEAPDCATYLMAQGETIHVDKNGII